MIYQIVYIYHFKFNSIGCYVRTKFSLSSANMSDDFLTWLGNRIRGLRKVRRISQEQLAEAAELHLTYVSKIERGRVNGSISAYSAIARALGISLAELVEPTWGEEESPIAELFEEVKALPKAKQEAFLDIAKGGLAGIRRL